MLRNKLIYTHTNVGAKVQPHQPSLIIVFPTQIVIVLTICLQQGGHPLTAYVGYLDDQNLAKRRLVPIIANSCTPFFYACADYMWS